MIFELGFCRRLDFFTIEDKELRFCAASEVLFYELVNFGCFLFLSPVGRNFIALDFEFAVLIGQVVMVYIK